MSADEKEKLFKEVFKENKDRIFRLCYTSLNNKADVDDLFQEVMTNVWRSLESFRNDSKISTWIYRITVNSSFLFNKRYKTKSGRFQNFEHHELEEIHGGSNHFEKNLDENLQNLQKAIAKLSKQDRIIISLFLEEMSYDEIAEVVGISRNYVGVKINRIKTALAKTMGGLE